MATAYTVLYNKHDLPGQIGEGTTEPVPKTTIEKYTLMGTEAILVIGPVKTFNAVEITAENEAAACEYARVFLGANMGEKELRIATTANLKSHTAL